MQHEIKTKKYYEQNNWYQSIYYINFNVRQCDWNDYSSKPLY